MNRVSPSSFRGARQREPGIQHVSKKALDSGFAAARRPGMTTTSLHRGADRARLPAAIAMQECNNTRLEIAEASFVADQPPNLRYSGQSVRTQRVSALSTRGRRGDAMRFRSISLVGAALVLLGSACRSRPRRRRTRTPRTRARPTRSEPASVPPSCPTTAIAASACRGSVRPSHRTSRSSATGSMSAAWPTRSGCRAIRSPS